MWLCSITTRRLNTSPDESERREQRIARFLLQHKVPDRYLALAIDRLKRNFTRPFRIEDVAREVHMLPLHAAQSGSLDRRDE